MLLLAIPGSSPAQQAVPPAATTPPPAPKRSLPAGARVLTELTYVDGGHPRQRLDLYLPVKPTGPVLMWIHGGGWRSGSKANPPMVVLEELMNKGVSVASIGYRLSQDAIFPAQIEDCKAAIRWLRAHASEYGFDPRKIAAWGPSAGGHLAALLGLTSQIRDFDVGGNLDQTSEVLCVVDWYGPTDFLGYPPLPTPMVQKNNPESVLAQLVGGPISQNRELAERASPVTWATKDAAPILIMHGTDDMIVPLKQSKLLHEKLKAAGADVTLEIVPGAGHGGALFSTEPRRQMVYEFLCKHWGIEP